MAPGARILELWGLALLLGGPAFLRLVAPDSVQKRLRGKAEAFSSVGLGLVLAGALGELGDLAAQLGLPPFSPKGAHLALLLLVHSRVGRLLGLRVLAASLAGILPFTPWFWPAGGTLLLTFGLAGHAAMLSPGWRGVGVAAAVLHLAAAAIWAGAAFFLWLSLRSAEEEGSLPLLVARFSRLGKACFGFLLPAGALLAELRLRSAGDWLFTRYGSLAALKAGLGLLLLLAAAANLKGVKPRLGLHSRAVVALRILLAAELLLGLLLLTAAGFLVKTPPPGSH
jgi:copper transport protein